MELEVFHTIILFQEAKLQKIPLLIELETLQNISMTILEIILKLFIKMAFKISFIIMSMILLDT
jgi:hypothetical protein